MVGEMRMKKFAQVISNRVHWIFEADEQPAFAPNIVLIDITDSPEVKEGWDYDFETNTFTEPIILELEPQPEPERTPEEINTLTYLNTEYLVVMSELNNL